MISAILSLLGSSAVGGIIGGIFGILNKRSDIDLKKLDLEQERARWSHDLAVKDKDLEYAKVEAQGRKDVAIVEGDYAAEVARMTAIGLSHQADVISADELKAAGKWKGWLVAGMAMKAWIRPVITIVLTCAALYVNWLLIEKLSRSALTPEQSFESAMQAFAWVTGQAAACISYWFISRGTGK